MRCLNLDMLCRRQTKNRRKNVKSMQRKQSFFPDKKVEIVFLSKADLHEIHVLKSIWFSWLPKRRSIRRLRQSISKMRNQVVARVGQLDIVKRNPSLSESCAQRELYRKEVELERKPGHVNVYRSKSVPQCQKRLHALEDLINVNTQDNKNRKLYEPFDFQKLSENESSERNPVKSLSLDRCLMKTDHQHDDSFILWRVPKSNLGLQNMKRNDNEEKISEEEKLVTIPRWFRKLCACGLRLELQSSYPEDYFDNFKELRSLANQPRVIYIEKLVGNKNENVWNTHTHFFVIEALLFSKGFRSESFQSSYRSCYDLDNLERTIAPRNLCTKKYHANNKRKGKIWKTSCDFISSIPLESGDTDGMNSSDEEQYQGRMCSGCQDTLGMSINNKAVKGNIMNPNNKIPNLFPRKLIQESRRNNQWSHESLAVMSYSDATNSEALLQPLSEKDTTRICTEKTIHHRRDPKTKRSIRKRDSTVSSDRCSALQALRPSIKCDENFCKSPDVKIKGLKINCTDTKEIKSPLNKNQQTNRIRRLSFSRTLLKINGIFQRLQSFIMTSKAVLSEHCHADGVTNNQAVEDPDVASSQEGMSPNTGVLSESNTMLSSSPTATSLRRLSSRAEHLGNINNSSQIHSKICTRYSDIIGSANDDRISCQYPYRSFDLVKEMTRNNQPIKCTPSHKKNLETRLKRLIYLPSYCKIQLGIHKFIREEWRKACQVVVEGKREDFPTSQLKSIVTNVSTKPCNNALHLRIKRIDDTPSIEDLYHQPSVLGGFRKHEYASPKNKFFGSNSALKHIENNKKYRIYQENHGDLGVGDKTKLSHNGPISRYNMLSIDWGNGIIENDQMPPLSSICMKKDENKDLSLSTRHRNKMNSRTLPEFFQHSHVRRFTNDKQLNINSAKPNASCFSPSPYNTIRSSSLKRHNLFCSDSGLEVNINTSSKPPTKTKWLPKKPSNVNPSIMPMKMKTHRQSPVNLNNKMPMSTKKPRRKIINNATSIFSRDTKRSSNMNAMIPNNHKNAIPRTPVSSLNTDSAVPEDPEMSKSPTSPSPPHQRRELNVYDYNQFPAKEHNPTHYQSNGKSKIIQTDRESLVENDDSDNLPEDHPKAFSDDTSNPENIPVDDAFIFTEPTQQEYGNNVPKSLYIPYREYSRKKDPLSKHGKITQALNSYRREQSVLDEYSSNHYINDSSRRAIPIHSDANSIGSSAETLNGIKHRDSMTLFDKSKNENGYLSAIRHRRYDYAFKRRQQNELNIPSFSSSRKRVDFAHGVLVNDQPCRMKSRHDPLTARMIPLCTSSSEGSSLGRRQRSNISPRAKPSCVSSYATSCMPSRLYKYGASKYDYGKSGARASRSCNYSDEKMFRPKVKSDNDSLEKVQLSSTENLMKFQLQVLSYINQILCTGLSQTVTRNCDCSKKTPLETSTNTAASSSPPHSRWLTDSRFIDPSTRRTGVYRDTNALLELARSRSGQMTSILQDKIETNKPYRGRVHQKDCLSYSDRKCRSLTKSCTVDKGAQTEIYAICDDFISGGLSKCSKIKNNESFEVSDLTWMHENSLAAQIDNVRDMSLLPNDQPVASHVSDTNDQETTMLYKSSNTAQTPSSYSKRKEKVLINKKCQVGRSKIISTSRTQMHSVYSTGQANSDSSNKECRQQDVGWSTKLDEWIQCPKTGVIEICADPNPKEGNVKATNGACDSESISIWQKTKKTYRCNDRSKEHYHYKDETGTSEQSDIRTSTIDQIKLDCLQKCKKMKNDVGSTKYISDSTNTKYSAAVSAKNEKCPATSDAPPLRSPIIHIRYRTRKGAGSRLSKKFVAPEKQPKSVEQEMGQKLTEVIRRSLDLQEEILKLQESSLNEKGETLKEKEEKMTDTYPTSPAPNAMTNDGDLQDVESCENSNSNAKDSWPCRYYDVKGYSFHATSAKQNKKFTQIPVQLDNVSQEKLTVPPVEGSFIIDNSSLLLSNRHFFEGHLTSQKSPCKLDVPCHQKTIHCCKGNRFPDEKEQKTMQLINNLKKEGCRANDVYYPGNKHKCYTQLSEGQSKIYDESNVQDMVSNILNINRQTTSIKKVQQVSNRKFKLREEARKGLENKVISVCDGSYKTNNKCPGEVRDEKRMDFSQNCRSSETIKIESKHEEDIQLENSDSLSPTLPYQTPVGNYWFSQWDMNCVGFAQTHLSMNQRMPSQHDAIANDRCSNLNELVFTGRIKSDSSQKYLFDDRCLSSTLQKQAFSEKCHDKKPLNMMSKDILLERDEKYELPNSTNTIHSKGSQFFKKRSSMVEAWGHKSSNCPNDILGLDKSKCTDQTYGSIMTKEVQNGELSDSKSSTHGIEEIPLDTDSELHGERKIGQLSFSGSPSINRRIDSMQPVAFTEPFKTKESVLMQSLTKPSTQCISLIKNNTYLEQKDCKGGGNMNKSTKWKRCLESSENHHRKTADSTSVQDNIVSVEKKSNGHDDVDSTDSIIISSLESTSFKSKSIDTETHIIYTADLIGGREDMKMAHSSQQSTKSIQPKSREVEGDTQKNGLSNLIINWWNCPNVNEASIHEISHTNDIKNEGSWERHKIVSQSSSHLDDDLAIVNNSTIGFLDRNGRFDDNIKVNKACKDSENHASTTDCRFQPSFTTDVTICPGNDEKINGKFKQRLTKPRSPSLFDSASGDHSNSSRDGNLIQSHTPLVGIGHLVEADDSKVILEGAFIKDPTCRYPMHTLRSLSQAKRDVLNFRLVITHESNSDPHSNGRQTLHGTYRRQIEVISDKFFTWCFSS